MIKYNCTNIKALPIYKEVVLEKNGIIFLQKARNPELKLMNYGYDSPNLSLKLDDDDEIERYPIQLYHHVASQTELKDKIVLEVGSGRGGGASYIARYLNPLAIRGIDISKDVVMLCNDLYNISSLDFSFGDSEDIPFLIILMML